ncbi:putative N-acetylmannosamine-6-phosphate 2-epimerase [Ornithinibacillus sp. L9]|uniref:Putative N-acetylmannosamine-6-phosphate 2-epimerase n=1 Tax=Ornithinibacillus caprae TaxID=2678566 RepID=A0A6N8FH54_9BACI|nr:putative N-acetylmannosamine-6-phosphate 2-epimerase [Ornithinibacillus caprae]
MLKQIKGKLIVSCQALENEPLHGSDIMAKMALAADIGGAVAIRANGSDDIAAIKQVTKLPIIGLVKRIYSGSDVYITPTKKEVDELLQVGVDMIAIDATVRDRPNEESLPDLIQYMKAHDQLILADISTVEEGIHAIDLGADFVSTTLSGYTEYTKREQSGPDIELVEKLVHATDAPVFAEGRIESPTVAKQMIQKGAHTVVVGSAITRPQCITKSFVDGLSD